MHGISLNLLSMLPQNLIQNDHVMSRTWGLIVNMCKEVIYFSLSRSSHIPLHLRTQFWPAGAVIGPV